MPKLDINGLVRISDEEIRACRPYLDKYEGESFRIVRQPDAEHVILACESDPNVYVDGMIHLSSLENVNESE